LSLRVAQRTSGDWVFAWRLGAEQRLVIGHVVMREVLTLIAMALVRWRWLFQLGGAR